MLKECTSLESLNTVNDTYALCVINTPTTFLLFSDFYGFLWCILTLVLDAQLDTGIFNIVITELFFLNTFLSQYIYVQEIFDDLKRHLINLIIFLLYKITYMKINNINGLAGVVFVLIAILSVRIHDKYYIFVYSLNEDAFRRKCFKNKR